MRVIVAEFNELSPVLMEKFISAGKLPNFARMREESQVYLTESEDEPELEPWVQWVTLHAGVPLSEHGVENLGDGHKLRQPNIWNLLSDAGKTVWVCGSMNLSYQAPIRGWVLPDPWMTHVEPYPAGEFDDYYRFVTANVQEHSRRETPLTRGDQLRFLRYMARHGLTPATAVTIVKQLLEERRSDVYWKRAAILDRLQFDLFSWYQRKKQPDFSTFFLNSTAHYQHLYWRNMEPEHFKIKPSAESQAVYQDAILFGYEQMDRLCGQLMKLAGDDTALILATGLSQQPFLAYEDEGGKVVYRPRDFDEFVRTAGIDNAPPAAPVMTESFQLRFDDEGSARDAEQKLLAVRYQGEQLLAVARDGNDVKAGCAAYGMVPEDAVIEIGEDGRTVPFYDCFYRLDLIKSGMHHRDGILWIRKPDRRAARHAKATPVVSVAPTILELMGVARPDYMAQPLSTDLVQKPTTAVATD